MLSNPRYAGRVVYRGEVLAGVEAAWEPLVAAEVFDVVAARLADPSRRTGGAGTDRRCLGSSLFLCDTCGGPVTAVNGNRYRCRSDSAGHIDRVRAGIDAFVLDVIAERLSRPDLAALLAPDEDDLKPWIARAGRLRARLAGIDGEYGEGVIDGRRHRGRSIQRVGKLAEAFEPKEEFSSAWCHR